MISFLLQLYPSGREKKTRQIDYNRKQKQNNLHQALIRSMTFRQGMNS